MTRAKPIATITHTGRGIQRLLELHAQHQQREIERAALQAEEAREWQLETRPALQIAAD